MWIRALTGVVFGLLLLLQYRLWVGDGSLADVTRLERDIQKQQQVNDQLRERNHVLAREVDELKSGLDSVEERARKDMGMIRKGEKFYLIVDDNNSPATHRTP